MRVVAFADLHGELSDMAPIWAASQEADLTVVVGDITSFGTPAQAQRAVREIQKHSRCVLAVAGNCDSPAINRELDDMGVGIHADGRVMDQVGFFGVSGSSPTPFGTPFELSEDQIAGALQSGLQKVSAAPSKVLVSHPPPWGTPLDLVGSGQHAGSRSVRAFIERHQPALVLCGHIHEAAGRYRLGATTILNLGRARAGCFAVIDLGPQIDIRQFGASSGNCDTGRRVS